MMVIVFEMMSNEYIKKENLELNFYKVTDNEKGQ